MALDNESARDQADFLHHCYRDRSVTINPIIDWTDSDVWTFLHHYGCEGNPLYQCGKHRIGCIGCPMQSKDMQRREFLMYPKYKANYIRAFGRMLKVREERGKKAYLWENGYDVFRWWTHDIYEDPNQLSFFDDDEVLDIMSEMR